MSLQRNFIICNKSNEFSTNNNDNNNNKKALLSYWKKQNIQITEFLQRRNLATLMKFNWLIDE